MCRMQQMAKYIASPLLLFDKGDGKSALMCLTSIFSLEVIPGTQIRNSRQVPSRTYWLREKNISSWWLADWGVVIIAHTSTYFCWNFVTHRWRKRQTHAYIREDFSSLPTAREWKFSLLPTTRKWEESDVKERYVQFLRGTRWMQPQALCEHLLLWRKKQTNKQTFSWLWRPWVLPDVQNSWSRKTFINHPVLDVARTTWSSDGK